MPEVVSVVDELTQKVLKLLPSAPKEEIQQKLKLLIQEFKVPPREAMTTVVNLLRRNYVADAPLVKVAELQPNASATVRVKVVRMFRGKSGKVKQIGVAGDETGVVRFVVFNRNVSVEEGRSYEFRNVSVDEFNGKVTIAITSLSEVEELSEDIEVAEAAEEESFEGAIVAVQKNSGLVQRCKECGRVASRGICAVHGKTETEEVLRAKVVVDNGEEVIQAVLDESTIEKLTGLTKEKAAEIAKQHGREATYDYLVEKLVGRYVKLVGRRGTYYLITAQAEVVA